MQLQFRESETGLIKASRIYKDGGLDPAFLIENYIVLKMANRYGLSIAGSFGLHLGHHRPSELPNDLDFVTDNFDGAMAFVTSLARVLQDKRCYMRVTLSSHTKFVPVTANQHIHIECPFWKSICVFVLPVGAVRSWWFGRGLRVQKYDDIVAAAKSLREVDGKPPPPHFDLHDDDIQDDEPDEDDEDQDEQPDEIDFEIRRSNDLADLDTEERRSSIERS
jgi:hypothetical protein